MRASLSLCRPKKNKQLQVRKTEKLSWQTAGFGTRGTSIYLKGPPSSTLSRMRDWEDTREQGSSHSFDLSVCICVMKEPLFSWQAAQPGDDASSNLHEMDVVVLRPLTEWKGCLFWLGLGLCIYWVETFSGQCKAPWWSTSTKPHAVFLHSDTDKAFLSIDSLSYFCLHLTHLK